MLRSSSVVFGIVLGLCVGAQLGSAQQIDLSLNLDYNVITDPSSGGVWTLVGKANLESFGIANISVHLSDIETALPAGPGGIVNADSDPAGFNSSFLLLPIGDPDDNIFNITAAQSPLDAGELGTGEQNIFYGIGTLSNGSPDFVGRDPSTNFVGPSMATLQDITGIPWGLPDSDFRDEAAWDIAVPLATGIFLGNQRPDFADDYIAHGSVYLNVGTSNMVGLMSCGSHNPGGFDANCDEPSEETPVSLVVRSNLEAGGDYNRDGVVNAADYIVWRNSLGDTGVPPGDGADGDQDGEITQNDYDIWVNNYGRGISGAAASAAVPEPTAAVLILLAGLEMLLFGRNMASFDRG
jgi:hypothetical protein